jgi:hypothetical protein
MDLAYLTQRVLRVTSVVPGALRSGDHAKASQVFSDFKAEVAAIRPTPEDIEAALQSLIAQKGFKGSQASEILEKWLEEFADRGVYDVLEKPVIPQQFAGPQFSRDLPQPQSDDDFLECVKTDIVRRLVLSKRSIVVSGEPYQVIALMRLLLLTPYRWAHESLAMGRHALYPRYSIIDITGGGWMGLERLPDTVLTPSGTVEEATIRISRRVAQAFDLLQTRIKEKVAWNRTPPPKPSNGPEANWEQFCLVIYDWAAIWQPIESIPPHQKRSCGANYLLSHLTTLIQQGGSYGIKVVLGCSSYRKSATGLGPDLVRSSVLAVVGGIDPDGEGGYQRVQSACSDRHLWDEDIAERMARAFKVARAGFPKFPLIFCSQGDISIGPMASCQQPNATPSQIKALPSRMGSMDAYPYGRPVATPKVVANPFPEPTVDSPLGQQQQEEEFNETALVS